MANKQNKIEEPRVELPDIDNKTTTGVAVICIISANNYHHSGSIYKIDGHFIPSYLNMPTLQSVSLLTQNMANYAIPRWGCEADSTLYSVLHINMPYTHDIMVATDTSMQWKSHV